VRQPEDGFEFPADCTVSVLLTYPEQVALHALARGSGCKRSKFLREAIRAAFGGELYSYGVELLKASGNPLAHEMLKEKGLL